MRKKNLRIDDNYKDLQCSIICENPISIPSNTLVSEGHEDMKTLSREVG